MLKKQSIATVVLFATVPIAAARAQSIYIDFGVGSPPSSSYAAAAEAPGVWNQVLTPTSNDALVDVQGQATAATFSATNCDWSTGPSDPHAGGDHGALLDDWLYGDCFGGATVTVAGLTPGIYELFVYPTTAGGAITSFDVSPGVGSVSLPSQGTFPGSFAAWSPAKLSFHLTASATTLTMHFFTSANTGVSGIQLVNNGTYEGYCFGDAQLCPCNNPGAESHGCANLVFASGALLTASGTSSVSADTVTLDATSMSGLQSWYFQGTAASDFQFSLGYGIQCLSGTVVRVGMKSVVGGASSNPSGVDLPLSVKGGVPSAGATRYYQVAYRQANPPCSPTPLSNTNRTNGLTVVWAP